MNKTILSSLLIILLFCSCGKNKTTQTDNPMDSTQVTNITDSTQVTNPADTTQSTAITADMAYEGVNNYCHREYDWSIAEENPSIMSVTMGEETDNEYKVIFRSYTGALVNFYVEKATGLTRIVEYVPALDQESEAGTIHLQDYLKSEE